MSSCTIGRIIGGNIFFIVYDNVINQSLREKSTNNGSRTILKQRIQSKYWPEQRTQPVILQNPSNAMYCRLVQVMSPGLVS